MKHVQESNEPIAPHKLTREAVAKRLRWPMVVWIAGFLNVYATVPQLLRIWQTHDVHGLSLTTFSLYFLIQVVLAAQGYFTRSLNLCITLGLCSLVTLSVVISILALR